MNSTNARRMLAALRSTGAILIGLIAEHDREHPEAGDDVGLVGEVVQRVADTEALDARRGALRHRGVGAALDHCALLDGMRQFMGDQFAAVRTLRLKLVPSEGHMLAYRKGVRIEAGALLRRGLTSVNPHIAEAGAETRLHEAAHARWKRRTANGSDCSRGSRRNTCQCRGALHHRLLFEFFVGLHDRPRGGLAHLHHLARRFPGLEFGGVVRLGDAGKLDGNRRGDGNWRRHDRRTRYRRMGPAATGALQGLHRRKRRRGSSAQLDRSRSRRPPFDDGGFAKRDGLLRHVKRPFCRSAVVTAGEIVVLLFPGDRVTHQDGANETAHAVIHLPAVFHALILRHQGKDDPFTVATFTCAFAAVVVAVALRGGIRAPAVLLGCPVAPGRLRNRMRVFARLLICLTNVLGGARCS